MVHLGYRATATALLAATLAMPSGAAPATAAKAGLKVQIRVYSTAKLAPGSKAKAESWVLKTAQTQFIEGKTAGPISALTPESEWITLTRDMSPVMDSPKHGKLEARVRPGAEEEADKYEVLARILSDKARSALYIRVPMKAGAQAVSRIISGFDRPDVFVAVQVKP